MRTILAVALLLSAYSACASAATPQLVLIGQQGTVDTDGDGVFDVVDNGPGAINPFQEDNDTDQIGNAIDPTINMADPNLGDPGLGVYGPLPILPGGTAVFDYEMLIDPPGGWGHILLDFDADALTDAVYFGPLTTGINSISIPANLFVDPLWDLYTPGTYTVAMKARAPGMASLYWALPNITVLPVPEPGTAGLLGLAAAMSLVRRRRRAYR